MKEMRELSRIWDMRNLRTQPFPVFPSVLTPFMLNLLLSLIALVLLVTGIFLGYLRWIRPRRGTLGFQSTGLMLLLVTTFMGGLLGSPFWWLDLAPSFAWDLPPLASRMLAAAALSFAVVSFIALEQPRRRPVRLVLILLVVYLAPLVAAAVLWHLDRFNLAAPVTYGFFIIAAGMTVSALWYCLRQPACAPDLALPDGPPPGVITWLLGVAGVTGLWGLALFVSDSGPSPLIWAWPGDPLSSRLIGVMLLALAAGALVGLREMATARMVLWLGVTYGSGLALASLWNVIGGRPVKWSYVVVFGLIALGSAVLLWVNRGRIAPRTL